MASELWHSHTLSPRSPDMLAAEQVAEGRRREAFGGGEDGGEVPPSRWTSYVDGDSTITEVRSLGEGLELFRQATEAARLEPYRDLIERIKNPTFEETFQGIFDEALELLIQRQRKYGPENISRQGMWGVLTRIADDKIARLKRAFNGRIVSGQISLDVIPEGDADDTFEDACLDLMNYGAILLSLKRGLWGRPLLEEAP